jgi:L-rhamnose isomerase
MIMTRTRNNVDQTYALARERYAGWGVDTDLAIAKAANVPVSLHCWQADDVVGFERREKPVAGGGILATGNYLGRARTADETRADYEKVFELAPGPHRLNLHACYAETGTKRVERDALEPEHFARWMAWGRERGVPLDFNPTFFAHAKANDGFTLSHRDPKIRRFWVRHAIASRTIAETMAKRQGSPCLCNHWIPDGSKDYPADRWLHRKLLTESLDEAIAREKSVDKKLCIDYVESKLFGIGSEEYVVGSAEYYSSYALSRGIGLTMDMGHYHPTEQIYDKISSFLQFHKKLLLHVSRAVRWDSDHVVVFSDELRHVFLEIQRGDAWSRIAVATDFFDASVNRIAAYVIGLRATRKAILYAMLDPTNRLKQLEVDGDNAARLALMDEMKTMPFGGVWDRFCLKSSTPLDAEWMADVRAYEAKVLRKRK